MYIRYELNEPTFDLIPPAPILVTYNPIQKNICNNNIFELSLSKSTLIVNVDIITNPINARASDAWN